MEQPPFDYELGLDDSALYCVEMTEKAYRYAGLPLSEPVKLGDMERATEFPVCMMGLSLASRYVLERPLTTETQVYFPGNERHGIWSSPHLVVVVPPTYKPGYPSCATRGCPWSPIRRIELSIAVAQGRRPCHHRPPPRRSGLRWLSGRETRTPRSRLYRRAHGIIGAFRRSPADRRGQVSRGRSAIGYRPGSRESRRARGSSSTSAQQPPLQPDVHVVDRRGAGEHEDVEDHRAQQGDEVPLPLLAGQPGEGPQRQEPQGRRGR